MLTTYDFIIVGAGVFGVTAAQQLAQRQYNVAVFDSGPIPNPRASTHDISKVIRMEYGTDAVYMSLVERALDGWAKWNEQSGLQLYHNTGMAMLTREPMQVGGYEYESYQLLLERGYRPKRLNGDDIASRFPAWKAGAFADGFYHEKGGYAESGQVLTWLVEQAQAQNVTFYAELGVASVVVENGRCIGIRTKDGQQFNAGHVIVAAGAWTPFIVPDLQPVMKATGHPVFHLKPRDPTLFMQTHFPVFSADIAHSGWYGFPIHPKRGVVKIANHGAGTTLDPTEDELVVTDAHIRNLKNFLDETFPALKDASITYTRLCLYSDTLDEHFWLGNHPVVRNLTVAAGGSGHGFKFAPLLGEMIVDVVDGYGDPRFKWRDLTTHKGAGEAARFHG